ncbi:MAG: hypothetical protein ACOYI8_03390 [Christensenellales bacterium]
MHIRKLPPVALCMLLLLLAISAQAGGTGASVCICNTENAIHAEAEWGEGNALPAPLSTQPHIALDARGVSIHSGADYLGVDVAFDAENLSSARDVRVVLLSGRAALATATAKDISLLEDGSHAVSFVGRAGLSAPEAENWSFSDFAFRARRPLTGVRILVTDASGKIAKREMRLTSAQKKEYKALFAAQDLGITLSVAGAKGHKDARYGGIEVTGKVSAAEGIVKNAKVALYSGNRLLVSATKEISGTEEFSLPFVAAGDNEAGSPDWTYTAFKPCKNLPPKKVILTVTDLYGKKHTASRTQIDMPVSWREILLPTTKMQIESASAALRDDSAYRGIDISFTLSRAEECKKIEIEVYTAQKRRIARASTVDEAVWRDGNIAYALHTATGLQPQDARWTRRRYAPKPNVEPSYIVLRATAKNGAIAEKTVFSIHADGKSWASLFEAGEYGIEVKITRFALHKDDRYSGVDLEWELFGAECIRAIKTKLYTARGKRLATNTLSPAPLSGEGTVSFSVPFVCKYGSYAGESGWKQRLFARKANAAPYRAVVMVTDVYGYAREWEIVSPETTADLTWASICGVNSSGFGAPRIRTHKGRDYYGLEFSCRFEEPRNVRRMTVTLYAGSDKVAKNFTIDNPYRGCEAGTFSCPFYVRRGTFYFGSNPIWHFRIEKYSVDAPITRAEITVVERSGRSFTVPYAGYEEDTDKNGDRISWESLFEKYEMTSDVECSAFETMHGETCSGIRVGMRVTDAEMIDKMAVRLYGDGAVLSEVELNTSHIRNRGDGEYGMAFVKDGEYPENANLIGRVVKAFAPEIDVVPDRVEIELKDYFGNVKTVSGDVLDTTNGAWEALFDDDTEGEPNPEEPDPEEPNPEEPDPEEPSPEEPNPEESNPEEPNPEEPNSEEPSPEEPNPEEPNPEEPNSEEPNPEESEGETGAEKASEQEAAA